MMWIVPLIGACAMDARDATELTEEAQEINGDTAATATQFQRDRAIRIPGCTATRIGSRYALTAAHCQPSPGGTVSFYDGGPGVGARSATIGAVWLRPGVSAAACANDIDDCWDSSGRFADIAVLQLNDTSNDLVGPRAVMAWEYPGDGVTGRKVGSGSHDGNPNPSRVLLQATDNTSRDNDLDGRFYTVDDQTDGGDSGGPFYVSSRVLGTLWGSWWEPFDHYNIYTSVPVHLDWILGRIGYVWPGQPSQANTRYQGTLIDAFAGTERECQYACDNTASCEAYSINNGVCSLVDGTTTATPQAGWRGALKHGARSGKSNEIVGYVRADNVNAVVHAGTDNRVHELALLGGSWVANDIHGSAPAVAGKLSAYRRGDGINAVVYRGTNNHVIELALTSEGWQAFDLTVATSTTADPVAGNPVAYVRADGLSAIVYRSATDGHIVELALGPAGWLAADLTAASGSPVAAHSDPAATVRADGQSSIVFRSGTQIFELYQAPGQNWTWGQPSGLTPTAAPAAVGRPFAYAHRDGTHAIVYRTSLGQVIELFLQGSQWHWGQISGNVATGDPTAYVRTDGVESVVFRSSGGTLELTNTPWQMWNLTSVTGAPLAGTNPSVFHRTDGYNSVLFESTANHSTELFYRVGTAWNDGDLTAASGETP